MTVYLVIEHDPYLPREGFDERGTAVCKTREKADKIAQYYNEKYAPYYYTVERCEVIE